MDNCLQCVAFHPTHPALVAAGSFNGELYVWDLSAEEDEDPLRARSKAGVRPADRLSHSHTRARTRTHLVVCTIRARTHLVVCTIRTNRTASEAAFTRHCFKPPLTTRRLTVYEPQPRVLVWKFFFFFHF